MKKLNVQRFVLAVLSLIGLIAAGVGIFVALGMKITLDAVAVGLLTLLIREIGGGKATAFAWFFDGSADKPPPALGTTSTTTAAVVNDTPAGTPDDPVAVHETPTPTAP